jgi:hypothetical protein
MVWNHPYAPAPIITNAKRMKGLFRKRHGPPLTLKCMAFDYILLSVMKVQEPCRACLEGLARKTTALSGNDPGSSTRHCRFLKTSLTQTRRLRG